MQLSKLIVVCGVVLSLARSQTDRQQAMCLTNGGYTAHLSCPENSATILQIEGVEYGANTDNCSNDCCTDRFIVCTYDSEPPQAVLEECADNSECYLTSEAELTAVSLECDGVTHSADFARIRYLCIDVDKLTTSTTTPVPVATDKTSQPTSATSSAQASQTPTHLSGQRGRERTTPVWHNDNTGLVIGLSVVAGVVLIAIIIIIVVVVTLRRMREKLQNLSHNSVKTLASSDVENSETNGSADDDAANHFGFQSSATGQRERLQKRNDEIKRSLSFKSEEKKNKRPAKLPKSSKTKKHESQTKSSRQSLAVNAEKYGSRDA